MTETNDYAESWEPWQKALAAKHGLTCPPGWYGFACSPGWCDLLDRAFGAMKALGWSGEIHQVKEKFGTLRLYCAEDGRPELREIIRRAEEESAHTCEDCGFQECAESDINVVTKSVGGWISTLCGPCRATLRGRR